MTSYSLFLGCIVPNRYPGIESATKMVFNKLGVNLKDMLGASCCPAPGVVGSFSEQTWLTVAARNLAIAEENRADVVTLCNGCFGTLFEANNTLKNEEETRKTVNALLSKTGRIYRGNVEVHHFAKLIYEGHLDQVKRLSQSLTGLKIAVHYGCHLLRPGTLKKIDNPEKPVFVDELVRNLGAESVDYKDKHMCCGAGGGVRSSNLELALDMTKEKLENVKASQADCILNVCAFCHLQFDRGQRELAEKKGLEYNIPVVHLTQLLGLAFGLNPRLLGLQAHAISTQPFLRKITKVSVQ
ncbi:MAG: CoB--CoM heterodisulfide reductase subunit B [Candidatus Bathyarchaeia archaeon]